MKKQMKMKLIVMQVLMMILGGVSAQGAESESKYSVPVRFSKGTVTISSGVRVFERGAYRTKNVVLCQLPIKVPVYEGSGSNEIYLDPQYKIYCEGVIQGVRVYPTVSVSRYMSGRLNGVSASLDIRFFKPDNAEKTLSRPATEEILRAMALTQKPISNDFGVSDNGNSDMWLLLNPPFQGCESEHGKSGNPNCDSRTEFSAIVNLEGDK